MADKEGVFSIDIEGNTNHSTILEFSFMGYEKLYLSPSKTYMKITLHESQFMLNQVTVTASASSLTHKPGKFIYTPRSAEINAIDSYDMLRFMPLVKIENNTLSILGKGTSTVYINGRKPMMDNISLMAMLRSLPAEQIEKIEIITTPGSSYKASTTGGILNIILKKNPNQGITGSVSVGTQYLGNRFSPDASLYLGYSKNKFNAAVSLNAYNNIARNEINATYNYYSTNTKIDNSSIYTSRNTRLNGNINMTYDFSPQSVMGAALYINGSDGNSSSTTENKYYTNDKLNKTLKSVDETDSPYKKPTKKAVT